MNNISNFIYKKIIIKKIKQSNVNKFRFSVYLLIGIEVFHFKNSLILQYDIDKNEEEKSQNLKNLG